MIMYKMCEKVWPTSYNSTRWEFLVIIVPQLPINMVCAHKELYILPETETFAEEPKFRRPCGVNKKAHWFLSYVCKRKFEAFGCFAAW